MCIWQQGLLHNLYRIDHQLHRENMAVVIQEFISNINLAKSLSTVMSKSIVESLYICKTRQYSTAMFFIKIRFRQLLQKYILTKEISWALKWRHNKRDDFSNHRRLDVWVYRMMRRISKKTSKLRVTGLCEGNAPDTGECPSRRASHAENVSIWWRHHEN